MNTAIPNLIVTALRKYHNTHLLSNNSTATGREFSPKELPIVDFQCGDRSFPVRKPTISSAEKFNLIEVIEGVPEDFTVSCRKVEISSKPERLIMTLDLDFIAFQVL